MRQLIGRRHNEMAEDANASPRLRYLQTLESMMLTNRTQESLDKGVKEMSEIYKSYDKVGIKDRSMIWNSYVIFSTMAFATT